MRGLKIYVGDGAGWEWGCVWGGGNVKPQCPRRILSTPIVDIVEILLIGVYLLGVLVRDFCGSCGPWEFFA